MEQRNEINEVRTFRYHVKLCHNEDSGDAWQLIGKPSEQELHITYQELIAHRKRELNTAAEPHALTDTQVFRNNLSTLHSFLAFCGKTDEATVGREMTIAYAERRDAYLESLTSTLSERTVSDRRSHLRGWQRAAEELFSPSAKPVEPKAESSFHQVLRLALANAACAPKTVAREAGASTSAMARWLKGAFPNCRAFPSVRRIEEALGLERDALVQLIPKVARDLSKSATSIAFRERHKRNVQTRYWLREDELSPSMTEEWSSLFHYKTCHSPALERARRGKWRMLPHAKIAFEVPSYARRDNRGCVTAVIVMKRLRSFFGYLALPEQEGGFGLPKERAQSLAWLVVPSAIDGYLNFLTERSDGAVHNGQAGFCGIGASLTHPQTGYLTQQPDFAKKLPKRILKGKWVDTCAEAHRLYSQWKAEAIDLSRKPNEPIQGLLAMSEPLAPLFQAVKSLDYLAAQSPWGSLEEAIHKRDALLLSMLMANPLRARNYILMSWNEAGSGNLHRREDGTWRLRFEAADFKNDRNSAQRDYDAPLPSFLSARIEEYLMEYRPRLLLKNPNCSLVFPTKTGSTFGKIGHQLRVVTRRHIPQTPGFGPHAVRHLVATDYLRKHPNDFLTVAQLLHDKLETVLQAYAHLRQDDAFNRLDAHLNAIGSALNR
jgi:integrase